MANITLRLVKNTALTTQELDNNFNNINSEVVLAVRNSIPWVASTTYLSGQILKHLENYYLVTTGGVSGTTAPTHSTGTAANGTLQLQFYVPVEYSGRDVLNKLLLVDGIGSGLDADLLDGLNSSIILPATTDKSSIVARDSLGDFTARIIYAALVGNVTGNLAGNVTGNVSGTSANITGIAAIANGGTGASTVAQAQTNLQVDPAGTAVALSIALG